MLGSQFVFFIDSSSKKKVANVVQKAFEECERIEQTFSRFLPESKLSHVNRHLKEWQTVSDEFFSLLSFCEEIKKMTHGAFDCTVKSILDGWGYNANYTLTEGEQGNIGVIEFGEKNRIFLHAPIDFGGIGKGYALDKVLPFFDDFSNILLNAGGDIYARGAGKTGEGWKIFFEHPQNAQKAIGEVIVDDFFLAASSPLQRKWRNRHHLVSPKHVSPAEKSAICFTQAKKGILADAFSTGLFVLGVDNIITIPKTLPVEFFLLEKNGKKMIRSSGFRGDLYY